MSGSVALIGAGAMGKALLKRLKAAGLSVRVYDTSPVAMQAAAASGAIPMQSAAVAAHGVTHVHVLVASEDQTKEAVLGANGVLVGASPGTLIFVHGTILPQTTQLIAEAAAAKGIDVLDAPITGVPKQLELGTSAFMLGGPTELIDEVRPYLLRLSDRVQHYGPTGAGNVAKLARAMLLAGERVLLAEVLAIVEAGGLDTEAFLRNEAEEGRPSALSQWSKLFAIENGKAKARPATNLFNKDVLLAAALAETQGLDAPMSKGAAQVAKLWVKEWADQRPDKS